MRALADLLDAMLPTNADHASVDPICQKPLPTKCRDPAARATEAGVTAANASNREALC